MRWSWVVLLSIATACAQPPTQELEMTAERVARAQAAEAPIYATESFVAAQTALADARQQLQTGDYGAAVTAASLASTRADEAYAQALLGRQRVTRLARRQLLEILSLLEQARTREIPETEKASLEALAERLGPLERALEGGAAATVYDEGIQLKNDLLELLNRLSRNEKR